MLVNNFCLLKRCDYFTLIEANLKIQLAPKAIQSGTSLPILTQDTDQEPL